MFEKQGICMLNPSLHCMRQKKIVSIIENFKIK